MALVRAGSDALTTKVCAENIPLTARFRPEADPSEQFGN
jgi:hypothetical protein